MDIAFRELFLRNPKRKENGIYFFDTDNDGDYFDEDDINEWKNGRFYSNWRNRKLIENPVSHYLLDTIINSGNSIIDLACGPSMGLIPSVKMLNTSFPCMATDASALIVSEWKQYLEYKENYSGINFAQFSVLDIPINNESVQAYSSFIGISSTRNGERGYISALSEIYRTLTKGGLFYTIENEWTDVPTILGLFEKMNQQPWTIFCEKQTSWHNRFIECGFDIIYEKQYEYRKLSAYDNELGEAAHKFGVDVGMNFIAYILKKN